MYYIVTISIPYQTLEAMSDIDSRIKPRIDPRMCAAHTPAV